MLCDTPCEPEYTLYVDEVWMKIFRDREGAEVSMYNSCTLLESHENSWETMVTLRTPGASAGRETSLLTLSSLLQRWSLPQDRSKCRFSTLAV